MTTHFQDFTKDDGRPVTVEFSYSPGSETTYSPMHGACGGDGCEVQIVSVMPNTPEYEALCGKSLAMDDQDPEFPEVERQIKAAAEAVALTDAENERMCEWIAEHHEYEPDEPDWRE